MTSILKELGVNDHSIFVRAAAIDRAASDLISRATTAAPETSGQGRSVAQLARPGPVSRRERGARGNAAHRGVRVS
jgi:hypothetical protein